MKKNKIDIRAVLDVKPDFDFDHKFKGYGMTESKCNIKMWEQKDKSWFVLFTDLGIGTSVTNASERLVAEVYEKFFKSQGLPKDIVTFAECYPSNKSSYDLVTPVWEGDRVKRVTWEYLADVVEK